MKSATHRNSTPRCSPAQGSSTTSYYESVDIVHKQEHTSSHVRPSYSLQTHGGGKRTRHSEDLEDVRSRSVFRPNVVETMVAHPARILSYVRLQHNTFDVDAAVA